MTLKIRLIIGFVAIAVLMSIFSLLLARSEAIAVRGYESLVEINGMETYHAARTSMLLQRVKSNLRELMLEVSIGVDKNEITQSIDVAHDSLKELEALGFSWLEIVNTDLAHSDEFDAEQAEEEREELEQLHVIRIQMEQFIAASRQFLTHYQQEQDNLSLLHMFFEDQLENPSRLLQDNLQDLWDDTQHEAETESARFGQSLEDIFYLAFALSLMAILVAAVAGISYAHWITRSLNQAMSGIKSIQKGDYEVKLPVRGKDEIAQLSKAVNLLSDQLSRQIEVREQVEERLHLVNQELDTILENLPTMLFLKDAETHEFLRLNKFGEELLGMPRDQIIGKTVFDLFPAHQAKQFAEIDQEILSSQKEAVVDLKIDTVSGPRYLHTRNIALRNNAGRVRFLLGVATDVTEEKHLRDELQNLASHDSLTGMLNRRVVMERLNAEVARATRYGSELSLIIFDVDHFKQVNDTYGHQAGDRVLRDLAETVGQVTRASDIVGRYGGEEFLLVLPMTDSKSAEELAERMRKRIEDILIKQMSEPEYSIRITISLGVASLTAERQSSAELIHAADEALYNAKREGRNRVCVAG